MISLLLSVLLAGSVASATPGVCSCEQSQEVGGWCDVHEVGFLAGVEVPSAHLYHVLDAHGHDVDLDSFHCATCQQAIRADEFCDEHRVGFRAGKAYFSRLTHVLAGGRQLAPGEVECPRCREHADSLGWCDACGVGMAGGTAIDDRADYDALVEALRVLERAIRLAERCEHCGAAALTDTECPICRITYKDGEPVRPAPR